MPLAEATEESSSLSTNDNSNNNSSNNYNSKIMISSLHHLKRYRTNKDAESAIVRLGRKGRTDEALQLYHAIWTLDGLKQQYKIKQQQQQKEDSSQQTTPIQLQLTNGHELSPDLVQFISKSKLCPTTRLMNAAIDACARSQPPARQPSAFQLFQTATSPLNSDGSKKPGGALSPNVFTFGSLLACCARNRDVETSVELLLVLEEGERYPDVALNEVIYSTVISACERSEEPNVGLALKVLNRAILTLSDTNDTNDNNTRKAKTKGTMGVVGFNAAISTMARAAQWKMAVQLLGEMILHSQSSDAPITISRTNPIFLALESIRDDNTRPPLLSHGGMDGIVIPKPDEVTFGTVLAACERSGEWEELLNVARAAEEYGVKLDGMALTSALHSCQQLGLAGESLYRQDGWMFFIHGELEDALFFDTAAWQYQFFEIAVGNGCFLHEAFDQTMLVLAVEIYGKSFMPPQ
jgi:hypothetical protein